MPRHSAACTPRRSPILPFCFLGVVLIIGVLVNGCEYAPTTAERNASFAPYRAIRIEDRDIPHFLLDRSALVVAGPQAISPGKDPYHFQFDTSRNMGVATATVVDPRGYFLTAAHCVNHRPIYLINADPTGKARYATARVVWQGDVHKVDLAILHASLPVNGALEWAKVFKPGDPVLGFGLSYANVTNVKNLNIGFCAGKLLGSSPLKRAHPAAELILCDGPWHPGDSGGPIVSVDGRLIGITVGGLGARLVSGTLFRIPNEKIRVGALRPDLDWLRQVIEADAAAHHLD